MKRNGCTDATLRTVCVRDGRGELGLEMGDRYTSSGLRGLEPPDVAGFITLHGAYCGVVSKFRETQSGRVVVRRISGCCGWQCRRIAFLPQHKSTTNPHCLSAVDKCRIRLDAFK